MPISNNNPAGPPDAARGALVWFRRDLRAFDHAALHHALRAGGPVHCVFVFDKPILAGLPRDDRRVAFLHASLAELAQELETLGGHLVVLHDDARDAIPALARQLNVAAVHAAEDYDPAAIARDSAVAAALQADGRTLHLHKDQVIFAKEEVLSRVGKPLSVFTPYKKSWLRRLEAEPEALAPWHVEPHAAAFAPGASPLPSLQDIGFAGADLAAVGIVPGMEGGAALFEAFQPHLADYGTARDYPELDATSRLSLHLRFGTVSIRHLVRTVMQLSARGQAGEGGATWLSELIWREFYQQILYFNPQVVEASFKPAYDRVAWETGAAADELFAAWCEGRTGFPLVDAAMVQLNTTGFMHNRLRMVTASFLCKDFGIDWRRGERYFALRLNDYELASNNGGWQWAASSGCDAQPFFRIFNPVTQSERFDKDGAFIRRYLPVLAALPSKQIHAPWLHGGVPGYPAPLVDHAEARQRTLERFEVVKGKAAEDVTASGEDAGV
ncbi:deoxyribodipyrimidine photo-lyase [Pseudoduganella lurida]|uniref:Deoxyribodipyrimidine photo-lyase n=1 Tax=Pseudoduganella lurida TaxID=1036180 RepID=A0A562R576_9BURK|nr:deoxyribodipyrimidine photo-lyase [Pseudoduganella lurida]TWI64211.1 deoxyribodipyrimidine photo-lyase [Pseudoduganella lurida]